MFPLNVIAASELAGKFKLTAGDNDADIVGYRLIEEAAPPNDAFGSVTGSNRINGNVLSQLVTVGALTRFQISFEGVLGDDDGSWLDCSISGVFVSGQQTWVFTRAGMSIDTDSPDDTIWRGDIGSQTDLFVTGNIYDVVLT